MTTPVVPNTLVNGNNADADEVQGNFDYVTDWLTAEAITINGGDFNVLPTSSVVPTVATQLTNKSYVDTEVATKAAAVHTHVHTDMTDFDTEVQALVDATALSGDLGGTIAAPTITLTAGQIPDISATYLRSNTSDTIGGDLTVSGWVSPQNGTVSDVAYRIRGDSNTGFYSDGAGSVKTAVDGANVWSATAGVQYCYKVLKVKDGASGSSNITQSIIIEDGAVTPTDGISWYHPNGSLTSTGMVLRPSNVSESRMMVLDAAGTSSADLQAAHLYCSDFTNSSDETLKDNLGPSLGLPFLERLNPFEGKWTDASGNKNSGKIQFLGAQDVEAALEAEGLDVGSMSMVSTNSEDGKLGLSTLELVPVLISAVQTLSARLAELEAVAVN